MSHTGCFPSSRMLLFISVTASVHSAIGSNSTCRYRGRTPFVAFKPERAAARRGARMRDSFVVGSETLHTRQSKRREDRCHRGDVWRAGYAATGRFAAATHEGVRQRVAIGGAARSRGDRLRGPKTKLSLPAIKPSKPFVNPATSSTYWPFGKGRTGSAVCISFGHTMRPCPFTYCVITGKARAFCPASGCPGG